MAIVANEGGLPAGTQLSIDLTLIDAIPEAHKVALRDIEAGAPIVRYGVVIGYAQAPIAKGSWVHEGIMSLPEPPPLDKLALATTVPDPLPALEGYTFEGFVTMMDRSGPGISLGSRPRPCNAYQRLWSMRSSASGLKYCPVIRTWMT